MDKFRRTIIGATAVLAMSSSMSLSAAAILFGHVNTGSYVADGNQLAQMLTNGGHTVTNVNLNASVITDFSIYDQVWVYDLSVGSDNSITQQSNYTNIANWYGGLADQNLIVDGRIISSAPSWTAANSNMSPEDAWIQNYATQLDLRGGGLMLGTDHASPNQPSGVFVDGINQINALIGINPFSSFFGTYPVSQAVVDLASPLFVAGLDECRDDPTQACINDNSTTSFAPAGLQPNGTTLTPVAYHGTASTAFNNAAVASTIGSKTFGTCGGPNEEPCATPTPGSLALLVLGLAGLGWSRRKKA